MPEAVFLAVAEVVVVLLVVPVTVGELALHLFTAFGALVGLMQFKAAIDDQRVNPTRGKSALDIVFAALETAFEAVKADSSEDRPPFVVTTADEHHAVPTAAVQVFAPVAPSDPSPRCG
ncbi:hypothetical protein [Amycolatopsis sp. lyj-346]|uniref:hypothetical protein n=1 Tax=Amycolatopsis sp. lyj-346 TaxID=2789289 RepID=UPI00397A082A